MPRFRSKKRAMTRRVIPATLAAAILAAACAAYGAEVPVGLEAQGVDAQAALESPSDLDLRDELGRPVSAALVAKQLKAAAAEAAADSAFSSRLPQAASTLRLLELWEGLKESLKRPGWPLAARGECALLMPNPVPRIALPGLVVFGPALSPASSVSNLEIQAPRAAFGAPLVLLC